MKRILLTSTSIIMLASFADASGPGMPTNPCMIVPIPDSNAFMRTGDCNSSAPTLAGHDPGPDLDGDGRPDEQNGNVPLRGGMAPSAPERTSTEQPDYQ